MTNTSIGATPGTNTPENATEPDLTLSAIEPTATVLTDVTGLPTTNGEFLGAIFKGLADPLRPFVLGFGSKPKDCKAWGGEAWRADKSHTDNAAFNWYFSLAAYQPDDDGYHRREKDCAAVYGVMLDDLGTKALPLDRLDACPPSYVIETSEGNFQAGYLFTEPVGVTLLELLNRGHPWGKLTGDLLEAAKRQRTLPAGLDEPTWLIEIALRAIHPDAALRFQTAADMAAALRARSVPVSVDRNAMKAHQAVLAGEQALKRGNWRKAESAAAVAQRLSPSLPSAVLLAGRIKLLQHQTDAAYDILKDAAHGHSGNLMGLELGWLYLQRGELPMALSTLSDEVTRNPLNIEAHCLLLECYWKVKRFDEMKRLADVLRAEKCDNAAIENAGLLARLGLQELDATWLQEQLARMKGSPFSIYNVKVALDGPQALGGWDSLLEKLVFQDYRFGLPVALKPMNTVVIEYRGKKLSFAEKLISIGKLAENNLPIDAPSASRRHAVIVNMGNEVWLHDLHSTVGTWVDGIQVHGKQPLVGVHDVKIGNAQLRVWSRHDLIA